MSRDPSLWVVALALDGLFDVFGDDNCPLAVFTSLQIMPVLKNAASFFKARVSVCICVHVHVYTVLSEGVYSLPFHLSSCVWRRAHLEHTQQ